MYACELKAYAGTVQGLISGCSDECCGDHKKLKDCSEASREVLDLNPKP